MPLVTRLGKGSRLTVEEMDGNFTYLEELAQSGSAVDLTNVTTDVIPSEDNVYSLGSSASQWKSLHVSGQTIYLGGVPLSTHDGSLVVEKINLGTTASPLILSSDSNNKILVNGGGYKGFYAGINRLFGDDPNITQIFISKSAVANYTYQDSYETDSDDFYVTGLNGSDTVVILNIYGADPKNPLKLKDIRNFVHKFIDIVLYTNETLNTDLNVIRDSFYDNIQLLIESLPAGSLYNQFAFQDKDIEYIITPSNYTTTSMTGSGTFSLIKSVGDDKVYQVNANGFGYGFQIDDIITISGTALGGQSPANDATIYVNSILNGTVYTLEIVNPGTGYTDQNYNLSSDGNQAYVSVTTASGSVTGVTILNSGSGYVVGESYTIFGGNDDATVNVLSVRDGVINDYNIIGIPDYRSPYRNSQNPWPVMSISDGGSDQYDRANYITTDKSITKFVGSIQDTGNSNILTVTEIISGTLSVGQTIRHNTSDYRILTGTLNGGVGTYSVSSYYDNDQSKQIFTAYGINYGAGEIVENNTFGTGSSYITLYDESIFAMVAINADIDKVWYNGDSGSDGRGEKQVNILIADNNTLSFGEDKLELSNKDIILPETETLGWMSVLGPLYNDNDDIVFNSVVIDDNGNIYVAGYEYDNNNGIILKFNKQGDKIWSREIIDDDNSDDIRANAIKIDPVNGDLVVICEIYPNYAESLILRIDPTAGYVKTSNRLKDLNGLDEQGDVYLYDLTFNSDNEMIVVGQKTTDYLEWTITTSSVLPGSTVSTLVISPSSIGGDIPENNSNWSIAGTGITGDETVYINYFTGLTGSVQPGGSTQSSGATFDIYKDQFNGQYAVYITNWGSNYALNDVIVIDGSKLGGTSSNNCILTVTNVSEGGNVYSYTTSGTGSTASLQFTINSNIDFSASGTWSIYKSLQGEAYIYTENWEKTLIGDEAFDSFNSVITDDNNNIYCVGRLGSDNFYDKAIISKFDQNGVQQWTKVLYELNNDCSAESVAIFGTNSLITTHRSSNGNQVVISKLTFDGELVWQKRTNRDSNSSVATDSDGIYVAVDTYENIFDTTSIRLFKLNSDGAVVWNNTIGSREDFYVSKITVKDGKIVLVGYTYVMANDYYNAFIASLPTDGSLSIDRNNDVNSYNLSGITNYIQGNYAIYPVTTSSFGTITTQVATHSLTQNRDRFIITNNSYNIDNNIDKIIEDGGIRFGDGTKQTTTAGIMPQNYQPFGDDYYLKLSDIGKHIYRDNNNSIVIPTNADVPFPIGTTITIVSGDNNCYFEAANSSITKIWGDGFNSPGEFYIDNNSVATLLKIGIDKWIVSGPNLYSNF